MVIQYVVQAYLASYVRDRESAVEFYERQPHSIFVSGGIWLLIIIVTSLLGEKLRGYSCAYTLLFLVFMIAQDTSVVFMSLQLLPGKSAMVASALQVCCSCALSLYSCLFKQEFTILWSHVSFLILLAGALGTAEAVFSENGIYHIASAIFVAFWSSFVVNNLVAIQSDLAADESFYAALRAQADWSILCRTRCRRSNS